MTPPEQPTLSEIKPEKEQALSLIHIWQEKERAAATAHSDHPAKENLHKPKYSISTRQMQERLSSNRHIGCLLYTSRCV